MTRILICEDDPVLAMDLEQAVEDAGATVCGVFANSAAALEAAPALAPDIALVDLTLADGETGIDVAAALGQLGCKIVVLSGGERSQGKLFSIDHTFIAKPVPAIALAQLLKAWCARPSRTRRGSSSPAAAPA